MVDQRPSNAPEKLPERPAEEAKAAAAALAAGEGEAPGGGGLGGADAGNPLTGATGTGTGSSRNSPIDAATPEPEIDGAAATDGKEQREAAYAAVHTPPKELHPKSL